MRIFKNCLEMIKEMDRELYQSGITVPVKHYQNKKLFGDEKNTKELIGVSFVITRPLNMRKEMLDFIFAKDGDRIEEYCIQEHKDRTGVIGLNPGESYKIRQDMWQKFMIDNNTKFDYTYSERMHWQFDNIVKALKADKHTRQAVLQVFQCEDDNAKFGGDSRIPCSLNYQFLIRNNRLHIIYHMRSNDYFGHFPIDIWLAAELLPEMIARLSVYPDLKPGSLTYFAGSLHAYQWDLKNWVIY